MLSERVVSFDDDERGVRGLKSVSSLMTNSREA
jgi:hypothetical protein